MNQITLCEVQKQKRDLDEIDRKEFAENIASL